MHIFSSVCSNAASQFQFGICNIIKCARALSNDSTDKRNTAEMMNCSLTVVFFLIIILCLTPGKNRETLLAYPDHSCSSSWKLCTHAGTHTPAVKHQDNREPNILQSCGRLISSVSHCQHKKRGKKIKNRVNVNEMWWKEASPVATARAHLWWRGYACYKSSSCRCLGVRQPSFCSAHKPGQPEW